MVDKHTIAGSFPTIFEQSPLDIEISQSEFKILEEGVFANDMDSRWHVFVIDKVLYLARSWTNFCIYKVFTEQKDENIILSHFQVNRDQTQYKSTDIRFDEVLLRKVLQMYLEREDLYVPPELDLPLIKATIAVIDPDNECKKRIESQDVATARNIYSGLNTDEQRQFCDVIGWTELESILSGRSDTEPLISLHLSKPGFGATLYFDKHATALLGRIEIRNK